MFRSTTLRWDGARDAGLGRGVRRGAIHCRGLPRPTRMGVGVRLVTRPDHLRRCTPPAPAPPDGPKPSRPTGGSLSPLATPPVCRGPRDTHAPAALTSPTPGRRERGRGGGGAAEGEGEVSRRFSPPRALPASGHRRDAAAGGNIDSPSAPPCECEGWSGEGAGAAGRTACEIGRDAETSGRSGRVDGQPTTAAAAGSSPLVPPEEGPRS